MLEKTITDTKTTAVSTEIGSEDSLISSILNELKQHQSEKNPPKNQNSQYVTLETGEKKVFSFEKLVASEKSFHAFNQDPAEIVINGTEAVEAYLAWTKLAQLGLSSPLNDMSRDDILSHVPKRIQVKEVALKKPGEAHINLDQISERLNRIEQKIHSLDETRPEYIEERMVLEEKKTALKVEAQTTPVTVEKALTPPTKDQQHKDVENLLTKKTFEHLAPIPTPKQEEVLRLKNAKEAQELSLQKNSPDVVTPITSDSTPVVEKEVLSLSPLEQASLVRESFFQKLQTTPKTDWYESPSQNRDYVNQQVMTTAQLLSGKTTKDVDMSDVQTARIFLFNGAPKEVLAHPAYGYVESFYNYQNKQGYAGKDLSQVAVSSLQKNAVESPYVAKPSETVSLNAVKSPFADDLSQTKRIVPSPFINLSNTKKKDDGVGGDFTI